VCCAGSVDREADWDRPSSWETVPPRDLSYSLCSSFLSFFCQWLSPDWLWHYRLGHVSSPRLKELASSGALGKVNLQSFSKYVWVGCKLAKKWTLPFSSSDSVSAAPFELVHSDVWGPAPLLSKGGSLILCQFHWWFYKIDMFGFLFCVFVLNSTPFLLLFVLWLIQKTLPRDKDWVRKKGEWRYSSFQDLFYSKGINAPVLILLNRMELQSASIAILWRLLVLCYFHLLFLGRSGEKLSLPQSTWCFVHFLTVWSFARRDAAEVRTPVHDRLLRDAVDD